MAPKSQPESLAAKQELVLSALELDQLVKAKERRIPRRKLKGAELGILWALRLYVIFMTVIVAYQFWIAAR